MASVDRTIKQEVSYLIAVKNDYRIISAVESLEDDALIYEVLIVCDGCDEEFIEFCENSFAALKIRTRILVKNISNGLASALNYGLDNCQSKFVARLDSDDINLPGRTRSQKTYLENNCGVTMVGGNCIFFPDGGLSNMPLTMKEITHRFFKQTVFIHPSVMYNMANLKNARYDERFSTGAQDLVMWATLLKTGHQLANIGDPVVKYTVPTKFRLNRIFAGVKAYYHCGHLLDRRFEAFGAIFKSLAAEVYRYIRGLLNGR